MKTYTKMSWNTMHMVIWDVVIKASYLLKSQLVPMMVMFQHNLMIEHAKQLNLKTVNLCLNR